MTYKTYSTLLHEKLPSIEGEILGTRQDDIFDIDVAGVPNNQVWLGRGDDFFSVTNGSHIINGGRGNDTIKSGAGEDLLSGGRGDDYLDGGDDNDALFGGRGDDTLKGDSGDDQLVGNRGDDYLSGGDDNDILKGGRGNDTLKGDSGDDYVSGNRGADYLSGGEGNDTLIGGRGDDIFVHAAGDGTTLVFDFNKGEDQIKLDFDGVTSLEQVLGIAQEVTATEDTLTVVVDDDNTLIIQGDINVDGSDFIFA